MHSWLSLVLQAQTPPGPTEPLSESASTGAASTGEARALVPGTLLAGRYRIVGLEGRGGMGEVYQAEDLKLQQPVALKFLLPDLEGRDSALDRFLDEARRARQVTHPNVCRVYDVGEVDGRHFLSMEFIDGENAERLVRRVGRLAPEKVLQLADQVAAGLAAAHDQGILHRDLKPSNIMIDGQGQARITDFGLAGLAGELGSAEPNWGTPAYMAPERFSGGSSSVASDLYAFGLVLYRLLTGRPAFVASNRSSMAQMHAEARPAAPGAQVPGVDPALERVILACLEKDPRRRPADAATVRANLAEAAALGSGEGVPSAAWLPAAGEELPRRPHWVLDRRLGAGGFGEVWLGVHAKTREHRVFKFCHDPEQLRGLQREITLFRLLKETLGERDDITRILDWSFSSPPYFIEAEYTAGGSLQDYAERRGGLSTIPLAQRLELVAQVATALAAAHSVGVLHKDVKPGNVLVSERDGGLRAQLSDFGIGLITEQSVLAKAGITVLGMTEDSEPNGSASLGGTRLYLAPELIEGKPPTVQADIYALGVLLFQMVVGDFSRALAPGWERAVDDEVLRGDIAEAVDGDPQRRLTNALRLAERLRDLEDRRRDLERLRLQQRREEEQREALARSRRRTRLTAVALLVLGSVAGLLWLQSRRIAEEADVAQRVATFLAEMFQVERPHETTAQLISFREVLDRGTGKLERELLDQPKIRARLLHTLGGAYRNLGYGEQAEALFESALESRTQLYGENSLQVAESLEGLAQVLNTQGQWQRAETTAKRAVELRSQLQGSNHLDTVHSRMILASVYFYSQPPDAGERQRYLAEAQTMYRACLDQYRSSAEANPADVGSAMRGLGMVHLRQGNQEEALPLLQEALGIFQATLGPDHSEVAQTMSNLGLAEQRRGEPEAAEVLFRQALDINRKILGPEHPQVASDMSYLALILERKGDLQDAEQIYLEAVDIHRKTRGEDSLQVAILLGNLANLARKQGDLVKTERLLGELVSNAQQRQDPLAAALASARLGSVLITQGDEVRGEAMLRDAARFVRGELSADHRDRRWLEELLQRHQVEAPAP